MASLIPYEQPILNDFAVISLKDHNIRTGIDDIQNFFSITNKNFPFNGTPANNFEYFFPKKLNFTYEDINEDDLPDYIKNYQGKIILVIHGEKNDHVIHDSKVNDKIYYDTKINAIINNSRIQFIDYKHLISNDNYQKYNIMVQLTAKCNGTPWIVDNSNVQFTDNDTLIVGITFSKLNNKLTYGVAHFMDANNMVQEIILQRISRDVEEKYLYLNYNELSTILKNGVNWFNKTLNPERNNLKIFIYKSTPLHETELKAINNIIDNSKILGYDSIDITHIHLKSDNFGIPRIYDTNNIGTAYQYMASQGTCIEIIPGNLNHKNFDFRGDIIVSTTGMYKKTYGYGGTFGTPKPLFVAVHSSTDNPIKTIENQIMAMTNMDWEFTGSNYRKPFIMKYATRMAKLLNYNDFSGVRDTLDIRDLL
jgi:hypothetical protein